MSERFHWYAHGVIIDVEPGSASVELWACQDHGEEPTPLVFDEAMAVRDALDEAIAVATRNAVGS